MGLYRKKCCLDTQIMEIEYLESKFFSIDPKGNILLDFMTEKVSECHFFLYRPMQKGMMSAVFSGETKKRNFQIFYIKFIIS